MQRSVVETVSNFQFLVSVCEKLKSQQTCRRLCEDTLAQAGFGLLSNPSRLTDDTNKFLLLIPHVEIPSLHFIHAQ